MTLQQNKRLNYLLTATGLSSQKAALVLGATLGRSESRKDLTEPEADKLIAYLNTLPLSPLRPLPEIIGARKGELATKMRRKLIGMAREMGYYKTDPNNPKAFIADMPAINGWCIKYGFGKKELNAYTVAELPKLLSQFEMVLNKYLRKF